MYIYTYYNIFLGFKRYIYTYLRIISVFLCKIKLLNGRN